MAGSIANDNDSLVALHTYKSPTWQRILEHSCCNRSVTPMVMTTCSACSASAHSRGPLWKPITHRWQGVDCGEMCGNARDCIKLTEMHSQHWQSASNAAEGDALSQRRLQCSIIQVHCSAHIAAIKKLQRTAVACIPGAAGSFLVGWQVRGKVGNDERSAMVENCSTLMQVHWGSYRCWWRDWVCVFFCDICTFWNVEYH